MFGKDPFIRINQTCHLCIRDMFYKTIHWNKSNVPLLLRRAECLMNHFTRVNQTLHSCIFETMFMKRFAQMNHIFQCYGAFEREIFEMCQFNIMNQRFHFCRWEYMFMKAFHSNESNSQFLHLREKCLVRITLLEWIRLNSTVGYERTFMKSIHSNESNFPMLHVREEYLRLICLLE